MYTEKDYTIQIPYHEQLNYKIIIRKDFHILTAEILNRFGCDSVQKKIFIICDTNTNNLFLKEMKNTLEASFSNIYIHTLPAGEEHKNWNAANRLYTDLVSCSVNREDIILTLGGGVTGDIGGFVAATYLRGIRYIQIPTTLLSMVDSSIGGKTGIDYLGYKNMIGAFHMPSLVYINTNLLSTLPDTEFSFGMAEVFKHALIRSKEYYQFLREHIEGILSRDRALLSEMIYKSLLIKKNLVEDDPLERGKRALLNFGHTLGHAMEAESNFTLPHGSAVALGSLAAMHISKSKGYLGTKDIEDFQILLRRFSLPISFTEMNIDKICEATMKDKKRTGSGLKFILLQEIGEAFIDQTVDASQMKEALENIYDEK